MSKFLAFAHPVSSAAEAKVLVTDYQKRFFDARHVCWAYMVGADRKEFLSNDNGEPSGTAGKPILGQINSFNLTDIVVVVVRYFGGIRLGTSGLITAYKEAARQALAEATVVERHEMCRVRFSFPYIVMNDVMKLVKRESLDLKSQNFDNLCELEVELPVADLDPVIAKLKNIEGVAID